MKHAETKVRTSMQQREGPVRGRWRSRIRWQGGLEQNTDGDAGKQMSRVRKTCEVELGPGLHTLQDP